MFVLTADQRGSRQGPDRVGSALQLLGRVVPKPLRGFERTAGDEVQGVLDQAGQCIDALQALVATGHWSVGVGVGPVEQPLPAVTRAGRGPAFTAARRAVEAAKDRHHHAALLGEGLTPQAALAVEDADTVLALALAVALRWSEEAREAVDLVARGATQTDAARELGVTRQAVGQRLGAALWRPQSRAVEVVVHLLHDADRRRDSPPSIVSGGG